MFSLGCAALGVKRSVLVDDFADNVAGGKGTDNPVLNLHKEHGVEIVSSDVAIDGMSKINGTFDAITCFDSFEHWHNSPKETFHQVLARLKPGGVFILSGPNSVNLRKRITVPLGKGNWSQMRDWYEEPVFRGHVREPTAQTCSTSPAI